MTRMTFWSHLIQALLKTRRCPWACVDHPHCPRQENTLHVHVCNNFLEKAEAVGLLLRMVEILTEDTESGWTGVLHLSKKTYV